MIFVIILFSFFIISCFFKKSIINNTSIMLCCYFLLKWITNYRKCTVSYIECKIRKVKKENGYIYNILEEIFKLNETKNIMYIYIFTFIILYINYNNLKY